MADKAAFEAEAKGRQPVWAAPERRSLMRRRILSLGGGPIR